MEMSTACEAPHHGEIEDEDRRHPMFPQYQEYRAAMSQQLVACPSFKNWLNQREQSELADKANKHPRIGAYRAWLRDNVNCTPAKSEYLDFWTWLALVVQA